MNTAELFGIMLEIARDSPVAAFTTAGPAGPRSRLVHPLWDETGMHGYILTDDQSPKVSDIGRCSRTSLAYQYEDTWLLLSAEAKTQSDHAAVSKAVADCTARVDGYEPSDFWPAEAIARLVVIELTMTTLEVSRFGDSGLEEGKWRNRTPDPEPS